jgi:hypothetical protein
MSDPLGGLYASWGLPSPSFFGDIVRGTYTVSGGTIAPTDRFSVVNSASAIALTLPSAPRDGCPLLVKNLGTGVLTLTATIDGNTGTTNVASLGALRLIWSLQFSTWLSV